jgi:lipoate---protein ligase
MAIRLIDAGQVSAVRSQTIYHGLGYARTDLTPNTIVLAQPESPYMCIGFFQDAGQEIDLEYCVENNIPVIRRETGGGMVYIDRNQLFVQWVFSKFDLPARIDQRFEFFVQPIIETYKELGIEAYYFPLNDVHVDGKKIVGTGAGHIGNAEIVTGNFLLDFNYDSMTLAVRSPNENFKAETETNLRRYLTTIKNETGSYPDIEKIKSIYIDKCEALFETGINQGNFSRSELEIMEKLDHKMLTNEWLFQVQKPESDKILKIHADIWIAHALQSSDEGLELEVLMRLRSNQVESCTIDLSGISDIDLCFAGEHLIGMVLSLDEIMSKINTMPWPAGLKEKVSIAEMLLEALNRILKNRKARG